MLKLGKMHGKDRGVPSLCGRTEYHLPFVDIKHIATRMLNLVIIIMSAGVE